MNPLSRNPGSAPVDTYNLVRGDHKCTDLYQNCAYNPQSNVFYHQNKLMLCYVIDSQNVYLCDRKCCFGQSEMQFCLKHCIRGLPTQCDLVSISFPVKHITCVYSPTVKT